MDDVVASQAISQGFQNQYSRGQQQQYAGGQQQQRNGGIPYSNTSKYNDNDWFCWSHGYDVQHDGQHCPNRWENHQPYATRYNLRNHLQHGRWCMKGGTGQ